MSGLHHLLRIKQTGAVDPAAQAWLAAGMTRWVESNYLDGAMLMCCLGVPCTASKMSQAIRNHWLCHAARLFGDDLPISLQAKMLASAALRFEGGKWHTWRLMGVDLDAEDVDLALFEARKAAPFPGSKEQLINIVMDGLL